MIIFGYDDLCLVGGHFYDKMCPKLMSSKQNNHVIPNLYNSTQICIQLFQLFTQHDELFAKTRISTKMKC